eukprot:g17243.t1
MSEIIDIPDDSSFSEDSCLVMAMQGRGQAAGPGPGVPESWGLEGEVPVARWGACAWAGRSYSCSSAGQYSSGHVAGSETLTQSCERLGSAAATTSFSQGPSRQHWKGSGHRTCSTSSDTSATQARLGTASPGRRYSENPRPQTPGSAAAPQHLSRSNSDPAICASTAM